MEKNARHLLSDLIQMVMADGKVNPSEISFIQKLAVRMDIPEEDVVALFEKPQPSKPIFSEVERITHFYKLILVMKIDNEVHPKELMALKNFSLQMGIRPNVADQILKKMDQYPNHTVPAEELLEIFKMYYN